jgi:hypothetical protein
MGDRSSQALKWVIDNGKIEVLTKLTYSLFSFLL